MKNYRIPVIWQMYGYEEVRANSLENAIKIVMNAYGLPNGEYLDGSFEIDMEGVEEMYGEEE